MEKAFYSKSHSYHPAIRAIGDFCLDCLIKQCDSKTPLWQKRIVIEKFDEVCSSQIEMIGYIITREKRPWKSLLVTSLLDTLLFGPSSLCLPVMLKVMFHLVNLDSVDDAIQSTFWDWLSLNNSRVDDQTSLELLYVIIKNRKQKLIPNQGSLTNKSIAVQFNLYIMRFVFIFTETGDLIFSIIANNFKNNAGLAKAAEIFRIYLSLATFTPREVHLVLQQLISILEAKHSARSVVADALLLLLKQYHPSIMNSLLSIKGFELLMKKLLLANEPELTATTCEIMLLILESISTNQQVDDILNADLFEAVCSQLITNDRKTYAIAMSCVYILCQKMLGSPAVFQQHALETLLSSCGHIVTSKAHDVVSNAILSCKLLINNIQSFGLSVSAKSEAILFGLAKSVMDDFFSLTDAAYEILSIISAVTRCQPILPKSLAHILELTAALTTKLPILALDLQSQNSLFIKLFMNLLELCDSIIDFSLTCASHNMTYAVPEQIEETIEQVYSYIDSNVLQAWEKVMLDSNKPEPILMTFQLLNKISSYPSKHNKTFLDKFLQSGGVYICLQLKQWDDMSESQPVSQFLIKSLNYFLNEQTDPLKVTSKDIRNLPNKPSEIAQCFLKDDDDIPLFRLKLFVLLTSSMVEYLIDELSYCVLLAVQDDFNVLKIKSLCLEDLWKLALLIAKCWHHRNTNDQEGNLNLDLGLRQGLASFLLDCIENRITANEQLPTDPVLLMWTSAMTDASSSLSCKLLANYCKRCTTESDSESLALSFMDDPLLLDSFMVMALDQEFDRESYLHIITCVCDKMRISSSKNQTNNAVCNVMERRLCELTNSLIASNDINQTNEDFCNHASPLIEVMQMRRRLFLTRPWVMLLTRTLEVINHSILPISMCLPLANLIVIAINDTIASDDTTVASLILHSESLRSYILSNLHSNAENIRLSSLNLLTALYKCYLEFNINVTSFPLNLTTMLDGLDGDKPLVRLAYKQLWYIHLLAFNSGKHKCCLVSIRRQNESIASDSYAGLTSNELQVLYFHMQQDLASDIAPIAENAANTIKEILTLTKNTDLEENFRESRWNYALFELLNTTKSSSSTYSLENVMENSLKKEADACPYVWTQGVSLLIL